MRISQVSARSGVPTTTLRYYEDFGLLHPQRAANGYRVFDAETLERLRFIDAAKQECCPFFGFNIDLHGSRCTLTVTAPPEGMPMLDELLPHGLTTSSESTPR